MAIATATRRDEHALLVVADAETRPCDGARVELPALARQHRPHVDETIRDVERRKHRSVGLRNEQEIVERQHRLEIGTLGDRGANRPVDESRMPTQIERAEQLAERTAREGVDDQEVGPQQTERVPDPLFRERQVRRAIDPRFGHDRLRRDLERREALGEGEPVGLARREKP